MLLVIEEVDEDPTLTRFRDLTEGEVGVRVVRSPWVEYPLTRPVGELSKGVEAVLVGSGLIDAALLRRVRWKGRGPIQSGPVQSNPIQRGLIHGGPVEPCRLGCSSTLVRAQMNRLARRSRWNCMDRGVDEDGS